MDECISNLVVTAENYVVQPIENIPISMIDGTYENIGIAQLVHAGHHSHGGPVIRLTTSAPTTKSTELHPLEAEVQRDLELKQQQEISRQSSTSVIHTVPEAALQAAIRKTSQYVQMQPKTLEITQEQVPVIDEAFQFQSIIQSSKDDVQKPSDLKFEQITPHIFPGRQMILQGKQYFIVRESSEPVSNNEWKANRNQADNEKNLNQISDSVEAAEASHIPLTVQNYSIINEETTTETNKNSKSRPDSDSEDEGEDLEPVYDYEPDPESISSAELKAYDASKPNKCYMCFRSFRQKKNMYAHIRKIHSTQPKIEGGILCPLCKMHALRQEHLRNHLETLHDVRIVKEEKLFNTMDEFLAWKEFIERETLSLYVSKSSAKLLANNQQKTYYKCHRSGNYVTVQKEVRKKRLKMQGSNKIGATCPAAMEVTENLHGVNVVFWSTHVGHSNDLAHLILSKEDRARIIECISSGASWDKVLEKIKKEAEKRPNVPSRLTLVSKQDLRNMKKVHDMKTCPDLFPARKKVSQGRKPMKERMLRRASQSLVIEKADLLLNILETTDVIPEFRPKVCLMIDNLISTVKRRAVKNVHRRANTHKKKKQKETEKWADDNDQEDDSPPRPNGDSSKSATDWEDVLTDRRKELNGKDGACNDSRTDSEKSPATRTADDPFESNQSTEDQKSRKRGRPKKCSSDSGHKAKKSKIDSNKKK